MNQLAIIGMGPRGLYALERLIINLGHLDKTLEIYIFEPSNTPGAGTIWNVDQPDSNWINITERALIGIKERPKFEYSNLTIKRFPSYHEWCGFKQSSTKPDNFPPRNKLGRYLFERFTALVKDIKHLHHFHIVKEFVQHVEAKDGKIFIQTHNKNWTCDDVLLTIGHQPTKLSTQIKSWVKHAEKNLNTEVFTEPYPVTQLKNYKNKTDINIGMRGFGLAMIDIMRYLAINNYGNFKVTNPCTFETVYYKVNSQNLKLVPFSLDGLPLAPKPLNQKIDNWFLPSNKTLSWFTKKIDAVTQSQKSVNNIDLLIEPMAKIVAQIFINLNKKAKNHDLDSTEVEQVILEWLRNDNFKHALILNTDLSTYKQIESFIGMALGEAKITLDFCIGQVWRHCQPRFYKTFTHAQIDEGILNKVVELDERIKRYSYGPPIESMQQLLALVDAEVLTLNYVHDPKISAIDKGWELKNKKNEIIHCSVLVNSVIDPPKLLDTDSKIIEHLLENNLIKPIHSELGIETQPDAYIKTAENETIVPIAVLGRLAKGSVIGVDAILECFGDTVKDWADNFAKHRVN
ncbi:FAD/NAD(P)-binding protein [Winogradskyella ursingii]|uniref:FAD/NAD(P)-binding protein n=1 Tax=Winogradskyella ursingii TaxID=2686079 RepID=UPI0015C84291|nr:FAD/NAD(P)-binding protein [Winogradskyella ursingii]